MTEAIAPENSAATSGIDEKDLKLHRRTAVLVVHGMGSQRALDTVRGVLEAVWLDTGEKPGKDGKRYWLHPEQKVDDIDLSVMKTSEIPGTVDGRSADFHELYWAHLMSETRAVAVLLWLFELVRKGPRLRIPALWWGITIFLCLLVQSCVLLLLHAILQFLGNPPLIDDGHLLFGALVDHQINLMDHPYHEPEALLLAPFFVLFMAAAYITVFSTFEGAWKIAIPASILTVLSGFFFYFGINDHQYGDELLKAIAYLLNPSGLRTVTVLFLPILVSLCVVAIAMGTWGTRAMAVTYVLSSCFFMLYLNARWLITWNRDDPLGDILEHHGHIFGPGWQPFSYIWNQGWIFWSLNDRYSAVIACAIILIYLGLYALFLQPFLGDAARYFRASPGNVLVRRKIRKEALDTLETLHKSGKYDRIIIVAHSLGTVVAYDMLRAYFSRINSDLPDCTTLEPEFSQLDWHDPDNPSGEIRDDNDFRRAGREIVRKIAAQTVNSPVLANRDLPTWLVTDFITLGSPLVYARYLMCDGDTEKRLEQDFDRRVMQREFPVCPPKRDGDDRVLSFQNKRTGRREFHHAALFGLTRWTNLYFPMEQLFWGDVVGGELQEIFGHYIDDIAVSTQPSEKPAFFTHTSYWKITGPMGRKSPQIITLRGAINLEDLPT
jgi:hypothetical protein